MSQRSVNVVFGQWFEEHIRLVYWIARKYVQRRFHRHGMEYTFDDVEEYAQDAVAHGFDRFVKRCGKGLPAADERKRWVCQCVVRGAFDAVRNRSRFGSVSSPYAVRDDAMNRFQRACPDGFGDTEYVPVQPVAQRWEVEQLADKWLPEHTRKTAVYAAMGISQPDSAVLQGCSERTIRNRLREIREYLNPSLNVYAILCSALECARRDTWKPWTTH